MIDIGTSQPLYRHSTVVVAVVQLVELREELRALLEYLRGGPPPALVRGGGSPYLRAHRAATPLAGLQIEP
jgi:hypothetical protein